jgi:hypothetical protein
MKKKPAVFFMTSLMALEEPELLCTVVLYNSTGMIIPPQAPLVLLQNVPTPKGPTT